MEGVQRRRLVLVPKLDGPVPTAAQEQVLVLLVPENLVNWALGKEKGETKR